jgi:hypothetical protein
VFGGLSQSASAFNPERNVCGSAVSNTPICVGANNDVNPIAGPHGVIAKVVDLLSIVIGVIAVFAIIVAGLTYVLSGGEGQKINTAKNMLIFTIVGIIVVAAAQILVIFVIDRIS